MSNASLSLGSAVLQHANRDARFALSQWMQKSMHSIQSSYHVAQHQWHAGVETAEASVTRVRSRTNSISQMAKYMANDAIKANVHVADGMHATRDEKLAAFADRLAAKKVPLAFSLGLSVFTHFMIVDLLVDDATWR